MLPALTQMVCSKQLLPQLSSGLHALGHLQLPWSYVKDMSQSLKPGGQPLQNLQHLGRQQCTVCSQQLWHHQHQQLRGFNSSSALYSKQLGDVMKVDLLQHKTPDEVEHIWLAVRALSACLGLPALITHWYCAEPLHPLSGSDCSTTHPLKAILRRL